MVFQVSAHQTDFYQPVADALQRMEQQLHELTDVSEASGLPFELSAYRNGKRLRPALLLLFASLFSAPGEECITAASALEAVHLASLFHDDVIDETLIRRGTKTLNSQLGNKFSILIGDYVLARATQALAGLHNHEVVRIVTKAARDMSRGQLLELHHKGDADSAVKLYLEIIGAKTASLMSACCSIGALLSGAGPQAIAEAAVYGYNLGISFQITDDILDIWGDPDLLGKPVLNDMLERKYTLPFLLARDSAGADEKSEFLKLLTSPASEGQKSQILTFLHKHRAQEQSLAEACGYARTAKQALHNLPPGPSADALSGITDWVTGRNN